jgi:hypothetical protein
MTPSTALQRGSSRPALSSGNKDTIGRDAVVMDQPSLDEWILGQLQQRGFQPLEQLASPLRQVNWSELFLAIDRLVRAGQICLWPATSGDIVLSLGGDAGSFDRLNSQLAGIP